MVRVYLVIHCLLDDYPLSSTTKIMIFSEICKFYWPIYYLLFSFFQVFILAYMRIYFVILSINNNILLKCFPYC